VHLPTPHSGEIEANHAPDQPRQRTPETRGPIDRVPITEGAPEDGNDTGTTAA
jgi:hypothetical protein